MALVPIRKTRRRAGMTDSAMIASSRKADIAERSSA
jgi:hypothetical protein